MAIHIIAHARVRPASQVRAVPALAWALVLAPAASDLLRIVQPDLMGAVTSATAIASGAAAGVLVALWLRSARLLWLFAAAFAACASLAMRLVGGEVAPLLSLLSILALGIGGAFASPELSPLSAEQQPFSSRR